MAEEVYMDIPEVQKLQAGFMTFHDVLETAKKTLQALSNSMHAAAWFSFGSTEAIATYIDRIVPNFDKASAKMEELSKDIKGAIDAYERGDFSGSQHFVSR